MTAETQKQVLENLRRIDWLIVQAREASNWLDATTRIARVHIHLKETIRLIESEPNQPVKAHE